MGEREGVKGRRTAEAPSGDDMDASFGTERQGTTGVTEADRTSARLGVSSGTTWHEMSDYA